MTIVHGVRCSLAACEAGLLRMSAKPAFAQAPPTASTETPSEVANEFRITAYPSYRITDAWSGFGYVGWVYTPDADYKSYYLGKGFFYSPKPWVQVWGGLSASHVPQSMRHT